METSTVARFLALPVTGVRASKRLTARAFDMDLDAAAQPLPHLTGNASRPVGVDRVGRPASKKFVPGVRHAIEWRRRWRRDPALSTGDGLPARHPRCRSSLLPRL